MDKCSSCKKMLKAKSHFMELISVDTGAVRNLCSTCCKRIYSKLLLKPIKRREDIELMVGLDHFLKKHKVNIES